MKNKNKQEVTGEVMDKIEKGEIKMKPKGYFLVGSIFMGVGAALVIFVGALAVNAIAYRLTALAALGLTNLGVVGLIMFLQFLPWDLILIALMLMAIGVYLVNQYDFSYKNGLVGIMIGVLAGITMISWMADRVGVTKQLRQQPVMHRFYRVHQPKPEVLDQLQQKRLERVKGLRHSR